MLTIDESFAGLTWAGRRPGQHNLVRFLPTMSSVDAYMTSRVHARSVLLRKSSPEDPVIGPDAIVGSPEALAALPALAIRDDSSPVLSRQWESFAHRIVLAAQDSADRPEDARRDVPPEEAATWEPDDLLGDGRSESGPPHRAPRGLVDRPHRHLGDMRRRIDRWNTRESGRSVRCPIRRALPRHVA